MYCRFCAKNDTLKIRKHSILGAMLHADAVKIEKQHAERQRWDKTKASSIFPIFTAGEFSGLLPVKDVNEIPDLKMEYKLLFQLIANNPYSVASEINNGLVEVIRIINLHVASGIPLNKIISVIVVHSGALNAYCTNTHHKEKYKTDNPNLKLTGKLKNTFTKFIACGQAMAFRKVNKKYLLPDIKISLPAKTVLSCASLKAMCIMMQAKEGNEG